MRNVGDIEKIYKAGELLDDFCADTACPECPIRKLCNRMDKSTPIGQKLVNSISI